MRHGDVVSTPGSPTAPEHDVVHILEANPRHFADEIDGVQQILNGEHLHIPGPPLLADRLGQRHRGGTMAAAGIYINQNDLWAVQFASFMRFSSRLAGDSGSNFTAVFHSATALAACPCALRARPSFQCASAAVGSFPSGSCA